MRKIARCLLLIAITIILTGCATQSADKTESTAREDQTSEDVSEKQLILVNSDIEYVYQQVTAELSKSKLNRKWARAERRGNAIRAAIYPPIVRSEQKIAGMVSSLFTKIEEEVEDYYGLDMASSLAFRGAQVAEDGTIVTDEMLQRARDSKIQYLVSGIIDAERGSTSATYAFDIRIIDVESGDVAFQKKVVREKP
ncbi:MAG: hypothetical protein ACQEVA_20435 [Myxococcota bacterium]